MPGTKGGRRDEHGRIEVLALVAGTVPVVGLSGEEGRILYVVAAILGIALYLGACAAALVYIVVPVAPYLAMVSAGGGLLLVVGSLGVTLLRVGRFGAPEVTAEDAGRRLSSVESPFGRDPAWPHYLFPQVRDDLREALGHTAAAVVDLWKLMIGPVVAEPRLWFLWPLLSLPLLAGLTITVAVIGFGLVVYGAVGVVLAMSLGGCLAAVGVLRGIDLGIRVLRGAKATCHHPGCNWRGRLPAYRCRCGAVHHDIRAGKQGVFARRCACGRVVPTTVLKAASGLVSVCQDCSKDLRAGAAVMADVNIPVFGPASAGKTRLVYAGMVALSAHMRAEGCTLQAVGGESESTLAEAEEIVRRHDDTVKTDAAQPPAAITVRLGTPKGRKALLHLFDAAGEFYSDRSQSSGLRFLDDADGLVFVLDPFSIPTVADELRGSFASRLSDAHPAREQPEGSYQVTAQWLRDQGVDLSRKPLAVALVKADLLLGVPAAATLTAGADSAAVKSWLRGLGLDNLLEAMTRDFGGRVSYHLVSSLDAGAERDGKAGPMSPARPLMWLLGRSGVTVPDTATAVRT